jgi:hypothetical protein
MKKMWLPMSAAILLLASFVPATRGETVEITGSHIPQRIKRVGIQGTSVPPLLVLDRANLQHSGATTVAGVLTRVPFAQVRGR